MDWGKKVIFLKIAITRGIFVMARNGFQYYSPLVMLFQMIYLMVSN